MRWDKTDVAFYGDGGKTIKYDPLPDSLWAYGIRIESRKRAIPHANGEGVWMCTTYHVLDGSETVKEYNHLRDAKAAAEAIIRARQVQQAEKFRKRGGVAND